MDNVNSSFKGISDFIKNFIFFSINPSKDDNELVHNAMFIYTYCIYEQLISQLEKDIFNDSFFDKKIKNILHIFQSKDINKLKRHGHLDTLKVISLILRDDIDFNLIAFHNGYLHTIEHSLHGKVKYKGSVNFYNPKNQYFKEILLLHTEIRERRNCIAHRGTEADQNYIKILKPIKDLVEKNEDVFNIKYQDNIINLQITNNYIRHVVMNIIKLMFIFYDFAYTTHELYSKTTERLLAFIIGQLLYVQIKNDSNCFSRNTAEDLFIYFKDKHGINAIQSPELIVNILLLFKLDKNDYLIDKYHNEITVLEKKLGLSDYGKLAAAIFEKKIMTAMVILHDLLDSKSLSKDNIYNDYLFRSVCFKSEFTDFYYEYFDEEFDVDKLKQVQS